MATQTVACFNPEQRQLYIGQPNKKNDHNIFCFLHAFNVICF